MFTVGIIQVKGYSKTHKKIEGAFDYMIPDDKFILFLVEMEE